MRPPIILCLAAVVTIAGACASRQSSTSSTTGTCDRADQDTTSVPHVPLLKLCAVDSPAHLLMPLRSNYPAPQATRFCYSALLEVVVDASGVPEAGVRVVRTNQPGFAESVRQQLTTIRFEPARRGGIAVRQIVSIGMTMQSSATRGAATGASSDRPTFGTRPSC